MSNECYYFGPDEEISLKLTGDVWMQYGEYEDLPENVQDSLQLLCHAVLQLSPAIKKARAGVLWIDNAFAIINTHDDVFSVNNLATGMAVMNFRRDADGGYSTDFFSVKQMASSYPIISYAYEDVYINGRRG